MHKSIAELIANQKPEKIRIIGHSMGGALAILAAIEFKAMNQSEERKISCFTLAAPIIGDQRFSKLFEEANIDITRLARADDFLPKLAPIGPYDGYGEGNGFSLVNFITTRFAPKLADLFWPNLKPLFVIGHFQLKVTSYRIGFIGHFFRYRSF